MDRMWGVVVILGKPESRGSLTLASNDPRAQAKLDPAYFSNPDDMTTMVAGVKLAREIARSGPMTEWGNRELNPSASVKKDADIAKWIGKNAITTYHFAGTCTMGQSGNAVCDARLRFKGVRNLRIADASAIPTTPVSALNAPSMLVGYRAARYLREDRG